MNNACYLSDLDKSVGHTCRNLFLWELSFSNCFLFAELNKVFQMSIVEGGPYQCYDHNFGPIDPKDTATWDKHCFETGHTLTARLTCPKCGKATKANTYPYPERYVERMNTPTEAIKGVVFVTCANPSCEDYDEGKVEVQGGELLN
jgi:hypothetical protein